MEARQTTSNVGHLAKPSIQALINGLNRAYYSMPIAYRKTALDAKMLQNLGKKKWDAGMAVPSHTEAAGATTAALESMVALTEAYAKRVADEDSKSAGDLAVAYVGKLDPKKRLEAEVSALMGANIMQVLGTMVDTVVF